MESKQSLIQEIINLSIKLNEDKTNNITTFVYYDGLSDLFEVRLFLNGWRKETFPDINFKTYLDWENCAKELTKIKDCLFKLNTVQIPA